MEWDRVREMTEAALPEWSGGAAFLIFWRIVCHKASNEHMMS